VIAVVSAIGLIAGLVSEGAGDWLSWLGLAVPVVISLHGLRRCKPQAPRRLTVRARG